MASLQLFYQESESPGALISRSRNPDGTWSGEVNLGGQLNTGDYGITAIQVPGTEIVQVFYQDVTGALMSRWRNPDTAAGRASKT